MVDIKLGDEFTFVAEVSLFRGFNNSMGREMPFVLKPIAGDSPRPLNVVANEVITKYMPDVEDGFKGQFVATYHGVHTTESGSKIQAFSFGLVKPLSDEEVEKAKKDKLNILITPEPFV